LCKLGFRHEHILDTKDAPRGQLPYLQDGDKTIGDSDAIIAHLIARYALPIDDGLTASQRNTDDLIRRMLDDLYWVMSYSRWKDERFWPLFRDALLRTHPGITEAALEAARAYNFKRYQYQGIGRYEHDEVYARGITDLRVLAGLVPESGFLFGAKPSSYDAARRGQLRFYCQYLLLRDRHTIEGLSPIPAKPRGALLGGPDRARRVVMLAL